MKQVKLEYTTTISYHITDDVMLDEMDLNELGLDENATDEQIKQALQSNPEWIQTNLNASGDIGDVASWNIKLGHI